MTEAATYTAPARAGETTRVLDPVSRTTEVLFGLIMVLTFTASFNAADAGREDVRLMLVGAIGCCLAWGLIDGAMYLLSVRAERAIAAHALDAARTASPAEARHAIASAMPPMIAGALDDDDLERIRRRLLAAAPVPGSLALGRADWAGAVAVFLLVFLATLPIAVPFLFVHDPVHALRYSHAIALTLLFTAGFSLGLHWNRPIRTGLSMVVIGLALVTVALALGG